MNLSLLGIIIASVLPILKLFPKVLQSIQELNLNLSTKYSIVELR